MQIWEYGILQCTPLMSTSRDSKSIYSTSRCDPGLYWIDTEKELHRVGKGILDVPFHLTFLSTHGWEVVSYVVQGDDEHWLLKRPMSDEEWKERFCTSKEK